LKNFKKTRIAPTPSGFLHLGNVLSFALTAALARKAGASILLRIDDLDRERAQDLYIRDIFDTLRFMGIPWDEGPADVAEFERSWSQVHRMEHYERALASLRSAGAVFACSCSRAEIGRAPKSEGGRRSDGGTGVVGGCVGGCRQRGLSLEATGVSWRFRSEALPPEFSPLLCVKMIDGARVDAVLPPGMRDFVVMKKDGFPAYQLTSVVDDIHYGVDLIVRGNDLWPSTLAQHCLSYPLEAAGFREIAFYHHTLLLGDGGGKLSKSSGDTSIRHLRQSGLEPAEIYSLILRKLGMAGEAGSWGEVAVMLGPGLL
jgi:glutamyl/glutaminyl-tRNA synthetase